MTFYNYSVFLKPYQVVVPVFWSQHGGHLPQVGSVALLLHIAGEGDRDDPLCDVDEVQLVALLQGLQQTRTPAEKRSNSEYQLIEKPMQVTGLQKIALIPQSNAAHVIYTLQLNGFNRRLPKGWKLVNFN